LIIIDISVKIEDMLIVQPLRHEGTKKTRFNGSVSLNLLSKREESLAEKIVDAAIIVI